MKRRIASTNDASEKLGLKLALASVRYQKRAFSKTNPTWFGQVLDENAASEERESVASEVDEPMSPIAKASLSLRPAPPLLRLTPRLWSYQIAYDKQQIYKRNLRLQRELDCAQEVERILVRQKQRNEADWEEIDRRRRLRT